MTNTTDRFIKVYSQANAECFKPLLDENGKPIVTPFTEEVRAGFRWDTERVS